MKGYIFRCDDKTKEEVFTKKLFGEEATYIPIVKNISPDDKLFLYNLSTYELTGPYEPVGTGGAHLVHTVWKAKFPEQIHFKMLPETKVIPFKFIEKIIKVYHKRMFLDVLITEDQVNEIIKLLNISL